MKSYSAESSGLRELAREAASLARGRSGDLPAQVARTVADLRAIEQSAFDHLGLTIEGLSMLDVGAGQLLAQMTYFASRGNDVTGIDQDVIVRGMDIRGYREMLRMNGRQRVAKTIGRKVLLVDTRYRRELARQLQVEHLPRLEVLQMDATNMAFRADSFDFVYAIAVFQHLEDPAAVLDEMIRVVNPGGAVYLDFILYTSRGGSHDVRVLGGRPGAMPDWAHLRPQFQAQVQPNAYLNQIRLPDWVRMFEERMPAVVVELKQPEAARLEPQARALQQEGLDDDYSLDELLTTKVVVLWRKPHGG